MKTLLVSALVLLSLSSMATTISCNDDAKNGFDSTNWYFTEKSNKVTINYWLGRVMKSYTEHLHSLSISVDKRKSLVITDESDLILKAKYDEQLRLYKGVFNVEVLLDEDGAQEVPRSAEVEVFCHQVN